ncbi:MAG: nucleoside triphosphate pyrophosphohydrolase [Propionibacteriaceae bacterium]|jgi:XTP/dITP diphosphohydrolase|nr:nucleoside triphosphate pyrophosphohydrolase [Propionibacteriaceae bacterium]
MSAAEVTPDATAATAAIARLVGVMARLRTGCPWDAEQTHQSLVQYLIEETAEAVEAIEAQDDALMREELGDLLFEVVFHAHLGAERGAFDLADLATGVADKLIARHPYVFADAAVPDDPMESWERKKKREKRRASAVDGIPNQLSALARANKAVTRARYHAVPVTLDDRPITFDEAGDAIVALVARANAAGLDPDQATRAAVRRLEAAVRSAESRAAESSGATPEG